MTDYTELKRLAEAYSQNPSGTMGLDSEYRAAANPAAILALIAENERLARNAKLNLCDNPAIHQSDLELLIRSMRGTSQVELAEMHGCTPPNIARKIRRVKERLGWKKGMDVGEVLSKANQLRDLASKGAIVFADVIVERDQLKAEVEALRKAVSFAVQEFNTQSSADGSGHADIARAVLRIAGSAMSKEAGHD